MAIHLHLPCWICNFLMWIYFYGFWSILFMEQWDIPRNRKNNGRDAPLSHRLHWVPCECFPHYTVTPVWLPLLWFHTQQHRGPLQGWQPHYTRRLTTHRSIKALNGSFIYQLKWPGKRGACVYRLVSEGCVSCGHQWTRTKGVQVAHVYLIRTSLQTAHWVHISQYDECSLSPCCLF